MNVGTMYAYKSCGLPTLVDYRARVNAVVSVESHFLGRGNCLPNVLTSFEFRAVLLLDIVPNKARDPSLPCYKQMDEGRHGFMPFQYLYKRKYNSHRWNWN